MEIDIVKSVKRDKKEFFATFITFLFTVILIWSFPIYMENFRGEDRFVTLAFLMIFAFFFFLMTSGKTISYIITYSRFKKDKKSIKSTTEPLTLLQKEVALKNIEQKINFFEYLLDDSHSKYDIIRISSKLGEEFAVSLLKKKEEMVAILHQSKNTKNKILDNEPLDIDEINELNRSIKYNHYETKLKQLI